MHLEDEKPLNAEIRTANRLRPKSLPPSLFNDVEDSRSYGRLRTRLEEELDPNGPIEEDDVEALGQARWTAGRLHHVVESELNHQVRSPLLHEQADSPSRLRVAYLRCLAEKPFITCFKQGVDTRKLINLINARVEKWQSGRVPKSKQKPQD
jgi:hypothetical protein